MNNIAPDEPAQGHVNITFEIVDYKGVRTNVLRESFVQSEFIINSESHMVVVLQRMTAATKKEILSPSVKTDML